ncbi:nucleotidyltransferase family protein [Micromonospora sp. HNM0581]|uniref:nucleotidyltransferase family protein n=1 Tax=Micromonospora sp. HNM0581 TaxID=2716341 RepID=UPI00146AEB38|nr:nucleotidyltransferase family protein [Micromonospora sp. HNM0581]NLU78513.1 nucleotidyltransferase family protein [Micromonospora sp. HNM0581]
MFLDRKLLRCLMLDAVGARLVAEFRQHGIDSILLKGRSIVDRLYDGKVVNRSYRDVDLLVDPRQYADAEAILTDLGFVDLMAGARSGERSLHASTWRRVSDRATVDLHVTLAGCDAPAVRVWSLLRQHSRRSTIGTTEVAVLDDVALACHLAMHAGRTGLKDTKPLGDLRRGLQLLGDDTMRMAAALARQLGAMPTFVAGLRLVSEASSLAAEFGSGVRVPAELAVRALTEVRGTGTLNALRSVPAWRRPLFVVQRLFPSRAMLRRSMPLAARGSRWLVVCYLLRPVWMAAQLPAAVRAWRRAARSWAR